MATQPLSPHQFMHHPDIAAQYQQSIHPPHQPGPPQDMPAPPHQFLFPQEIQQYQPKSKKRDSANSAAADDQVNTEAAEDGLVLPRSGVKLKLSRNRLGAGRSMGPPVSAQPQAVIMSHHGMPMSMPSSAAPSHGPSPIPTPGSTNATPLAPGDAPPRPPRGRFRINAPMAHHAAGAPIVGGD